MKIFIYIMMIMFLTITPSVISDEIDIAKSKSESVKSQIEYGTKIGLGFTGGITSGIGFAVRKHFSNRLGFQVGAFVLGGSEDGVEMYYGEDYEGVKDVSEETWIWANVGGELLYTIHRHKKGFLRLYALAGGQIMFDGTEFIEIKEKEVVNYNSEYDKVGSGWWEWNNLYVVGAGLGIEFLILKHLAITIELPLSIMFDESGFNMLPIGNSSLIYFF